MKSFIFVLALLLMPWPLFAKERFVVLSSENILKLSGTCTIDVKVMLTPVGNDEHSVYSSGTQCVDKEFAFAEDLTQWNVPEGQYTLWVNGDPSTKRVIIKKVVAATVEVKEDVVAEDTSPKNRFEQAMDDFGKNLSAMSVSLGIIEENLVSSDYAQDTVKRTVVGFLRTALDALSGLFSDLKNENITERPSEVMISEEENPVTKDADTIPSLERGNGESAVTDDMSESIEGNLEENPEVIPVVPTENGKPETGDNSGGMAL